VEKSNFNSVFIFPAINSNVFHHWHRKVYLLALILLFVLFCSLPAQAAVEGFVARNSDGSYHQYCYNELLDSYALKLLGMPGGLYEDYAAKQPVALFDSLGGYIDYGDVLNAYAAALLLRQNFDLNLYLENGTAAKAIMPASVKLVTLSGGQLVRESVALGQGGDPEQPAPPPASAPAEKPAPPQPLTVTPIIGEAEVTLEQALQWASGCRAHQRFIDVAPLYWHYGSLTGIRPEALYAQAAYETGFGRFSGIVPAEYNNWAGIKIAASNGNEPEDHEQFATPDDGVRAHFNHIAAYVGLPPIGEPHGRYHVVARASWAGTVVNIEDLSGRWAPSPAYHERIVSMIDEMK